MANLRIAELDFDAIKSNLKNYLKSQTEFSDYDFEGSTLAVLLDVLAYNTHYNAYLANMLANEMFIDSAVKRQSVVSIAKLFGYLPRSIIASSAYVDITVANPTGSPASLTLPRYSQFSTSIDGTSFTFVNTEPVTINPLNGDYVFSNVKISEGSQLVYKFVVVTPGPDEKYEIPNIDIDTNTLYVTVQESATNLTTTTYTKVSDIVSLNGTSNVYFIEENTKGRYEIYFGDGVLGKKLTAGNIVTVYYLVSTGSSANFSSELAQTFTFSGEIGGGDVSVATVSNSTGGASRESITELKFNAPKSYATLDRAVTTDDYKTLIQQYYPYAESVAVWGGEENIPPKYGKVIISLKPFSGFVISDAVKNDIKVNLLQGKQIVGLTPEFIDPEYTYIGFDIEVKYNPKLTTLSAVQIRNFTDNTVKEYFRTQLQKFDLDFYLVKLLNNIIDIDSSIFGCTIVPRIQRRLTPTLNSVNTYTGDNKIKLSNRILPNSLNSSVFYFTFNSLVARCIIKDVPDTTVPDNNGTGTLALFDYLSGTKLLSNIGKVYYYNGEIEITELTPEGYLSGQTDLKLNVNLQPGYYDVLSSKGQILVLDESNEDTNSNVTKGIEYTIIARND
jgi:hypothetical protein